jgi:hypothetical protein
MPFISRSGSEKDPVKKFESLITKSDYCWHWNGHLTHNGYAKLYHPRLQKYVRASRFSYETYKGAIPANLHIDHKCRNRSCVNPDHLEAVTNTENRRRSPVIKLDESKAIEIRRRGRTETYKKIAIDYGVSAQTIKNICDGTTWKNTDTE